VADLHELTTSGRSFLWGIEISMTSLLGCPRGITATGRPAGKRFRDAFLGTVASGALSLACGGAAVAGPDACVTSGGGTIATCSGNQSAGIDVADPLTTLTVKDLTTAIAPASGTSGIAFNSTGAIIITSDTGAFGITTTGDASGITASGFGVVTVTSTGNITAMGDFFANGIIADNNFVGSLAVTSIGDIRVAGSTKVIGISAISGPGAVTVTSTGNITGLGGQAIGISASGNGAVTVTSTGDITLNGTTVAGIGAVGYGVDAVTVTSTGNIAVGGTNVAGIAAQSINGGVTVISTGNIAATGNTSVGIEAVSLTAQMVTSRGNITAGSIGIFATNSSGDMTVTSTGNITAGNAGVFALAQGTGALTVSSTGNISVNGTPGAGITAVGDNVAVTSIGNIAVSGASGGGILAAGNTVTVTSAGNITAGGNAGAVGILAQSLGGPIAITIQSGTVSGGSGSAGGVAAAAVLLSGGSNNTLTNMGTLTALSGLAINGDTGNNTVNNSGTVIGNVILGSGTNAFNNQAGGLFSAGATVDLGAGNLLTNAGTLSPGGAGAIQTTGVSGNLVQTATGTLLADINIAGATSDRVAVSGTAALAGAVRLQVQNAIAGPWQQTILSATGGTTDNGLSLLASPAFQAHLVFPNATDVVVQSAGINFAVPGLGVNQTALANALNGALQSGAGGGSAIFNALLNGPTSLAGFGSVLTQLSGEAATGTQQTTFDAMNMFMSTMLDPFNRSTWTPGNGVSGYASEGDASAYAADGRKRNGAERDAYAMFTKAPGQIFAARWNVWAAGFGGSQTTDGNATAGNTATSRIAGAAVGADYLVSPNTIAGFALAGGGTGFTLANNAGSGRSDLFQAGVYARHTFGQAYISGALAYGWQDITTNRTLTLAGLDQLQARFNANAFSGRVEGGYRFVTPWMGVGITPYAAGLFTTFDLPTYTEQAIVGTNNFALAYGAKSVTDPRSELGIRTDKSFAMPDGVLVLRGRLAWAHDYDPNRSIAATFPSLPGASFVVNGAAQASDSALVTASAEKRWLNGWSTAASFEGEFSNVTRSYAGKGMLRYAW
jgi:uncharacterized protein with beta-barrel porin domain